MGARRGRPTAVIVLDGEERATLERWARRPKSSQALALRCRIVLGAAEGRYNKEIAAELGCHPATAAKWRRRFAERRLDGLCDDPRPGPPRTIDDATVEEVIVLTLESAPVDATHWSTRSMAKAVGISPSSVHAIWGAFGLKPHLAEESELSPDPQSVDKACDVVGLYLNPPEAAVVLCADEKTGIQALDRTAPILPLMPGTPQRRTHDYRRHGTTNLFAALDAASGNVITSMTQRHRSEEFPKFSDLIDKEVPSHLDVHVVADNVCAQKNSQSSRTSSTKKSPPTSTCTSWQTTSAPTRPPPSNAGSSRTPASSPRFTPAYSSPTRHPHQRQRPQKLNQRLGRKLERRPQTLHMAQDRRRDTRQPRLIYPPNSPNRTLGAKSNEHILGSRLYELP